MHIFDWVCGSKHLCQDTLLKIGEKPDEQQLRKLRRKPSVLYVRQPQENTNLVEYTYRRRHRIHGASEPPTPVHSLWIVIRGRYCLWCLRSTSSGLGVNVSWPSKNDRPIRSGSLTDIANLRDRLVFKRSMVTL